MCLLCGVFHPVTACGLVWARGETLCWEVRNARILPGVAPDFQPSCECSNLLARLSYLVACVLGWAVWAALVYKGACPYQQWWERHSTQPQRDVHAHTLLLSEGKERRFYLISLPESSNTQVLLMRALAATLGENHHHLRIASNFEALNWDWDLPRLVFSIFCWCSPLHGLVAGCPIWRVLTVLIAAHVLKLQMLIAESVPVRLAVINKVMLKVFW